MIRIFLALVFSLPASLLSYAAAWAEDRSAARIDDEIISSAEVDREWSRAVGERKLSPAVQKSLREVTVRKLVDRRLVVRNLTHLGRAASDDDVRQAAIRWETKLKADGSTLAAYLAHEKMSKDDWRRELAWQLTWGRYLDEKCSDENLRKFYDRNRPHYDGSERKVAHILWKTTDSMSAAEVGQLREQAAAVRTEIADAKLKFPAAAKAHSQSPTAQDGGELGWISRHEPMPEEFSRIAFDLKLGDISPPIRSSFGWHLITVSDERPGKLTWQDVREELRAGVASYLFEFHAQQERERTSPRIEIITAP